MAHHLRWRKSSFSPNSSCVEVADDGDLIAVRNSNHPAAGTLWFTRTDMAAWIHACADGEFDDLAG